MDLAAERYFVVIPKYISFKINFPLNSKYKDIFLKTEKKFESFLTKDLKTKKYKEIFFLKKYNYILDDSLVYFKRKDLLCGYNIKFRKFFGFFNSNIYSFESFLRVMSSILLVKNNGIILHSAAVVDREKKAKLYVGPSGSGKSTIAKKYNKILTDELSILILKNNKVYTFKSPFWGSLKINKEIDNNFYEVDSIYFLSGFKKRNSILNSLNFKNSFEFLLRNLFWVINHEGFSKKILNIILKISKLTRAYQYWPVYEV